MAARSRPRVVPTKDDDAREERDMWNQILSDLKKLKTVHARAVEVSKLIVKTEDEIAPDHAPSVREIDELQDLYREGVRQAEEEVKILTDDSRGPIHNLSLLAALRHASENEPRGPGLLKSRITKRKYEVDSRAESPGPSPVATSFAVHPRLKGASQRSGSVPFTPREGRDGSSVKVEEPGANNGATDGGKGAAAEKAGVLMKNAEVAYKQTKQKGLDGDWIQCIIISVSGEGKNKRYEVQDPWPDEHGAPGQIYRTTAASLVPIPPASAALPDYPKGKQVLARYPDTTTFYRAEVMGMKRESCRLKFEGEEEVGKEMDVDRRFVLDYGGK
ncbi:MAG: hypothetical protein M1826_004232 [Phylliscum demangeonii]|nr:MAG: hypothetical protein M1826_004232 [Phylliscum demangeonii]